MKIAISQFKPRLSKKNLERHIEQISSLPKDIELIIFPELSLNGYYLQDKVTEDSWKIEELEEIKELSKERDILLGGAVRDGQKYYNSALYFSSGELLHTHNKIHLPNYGLFEEKRFFSAGESIEPFQTKFGKTVTLVCEDIWRGETLATLEKLEPQLIAVISNSPARGFLESGEIEIIEQWRAILKTVSIFTKSMVLFVNRVGFEDGLGFWGGSMVIDSGGNIVKELPLYDEVLEVVEL
jgi:omega-amidase